MVSAVVGSLELEIQKWKPRARHFTISDSRAAPPRSSSFLKLQGAL